MLQATLQAALQAANLQIEIPNGQVVNFVIGHKGAHINTLQAETGTHIAIQKANEVLPGAKVRQVTISGGDAAARSRCAEMILQRVASFSTQFPAGGGSSVAATAVGDGSGGAAAAAALLAQAPLAAAANLVTEIPNGQEVNFVIGQRGATINALQSETGTHIAIQRANEVPVGATVRVVTISGGDEAGRAHCASLIQAKVLECQQLSAGGGFGPPSTTSSAGDADALIIDIPNGPEVNYVIGPKGITINQFQADSGTHIAIQKANEVPAGVATRLVTITGGRDPQRKHAAALIQAKVFEYQSRSEGGRESQPEAKRARVGGPGPAMVSTPSPLAALDPSAYFMQMQQPYLAAGALAGIDPATMAATMPYLLQGLPQMPAGLPTYDPSAYAAAAAPSPYAHLPPMPPHGYGT